MTVIIISGRTRELINEPGKISKHTMLLNRREREGGTERERGREGGRERERERETDRHRDRQTQRQTDRDRDTHRAGFGLMTGRILRPAMPQELKEPKERKTSGVS